VDAIRELAKMASNQHQTIPSGVDCQKANHGDVTHKIVRETDAIAKRSAIGNWTVLL